MQTTTRGASRAAAAHPPPPVPPRRGRGLARTVVLVVVVVVLAALTKAFVASAYYIPSASMEPTLHIDDRIVVSRLAYDLHGFHRGDVVVFDSPPGVLPPEHADAVDRIAADLGLEDRTGVLVKRIVGLPGDTVEGRDGHLLVDGEVVVEPYLAPGTLTSTFGPVVVPAGDLFVMGDNRGDSEDSRYFGPIPQSSVVGRAVWRVWPPDRLAFLAMPAPYDGAMTTRGPSR